MNPSTVFLISAVIGSIHACLGFLIGALLARHNLRDQGDARYHQGYSAGVRVGWYDAADEVERLADDLTSHGYAHRASYYKAIHRHLNQYFDATDGIHHAQQAPSREAR